MNKQYIPKSFPEKALLLGGGQFANQFIIVNVLSVKDARHPLKSKEGGTVPQATVEERRYNGIELFEPYLLSYSLHPLNKKYADAPLDTYVADFNGNAQGQYTKHVLKS